MRSGKNWPLVGYLKPVVSQSLLNRWRSKPAVEELVAVLEREGVRMSLVCVSKFCRFGRPAHCTTRTL